MGARLLASLRRPSDSQPEAPGWEEKERSAGPKNGIFIFQTFPPVCEQEAGGRAERLSNEGRAASGADNDES